ncbi:MAG TPA: SigE family RNA polymerase sigma factor [Solirubrobacteraceae bacterium]|nr:SigE family RNA polymerase sigma factor [Solirubrobacteraceae bacterium]
MRRVFNQPTDVGAKRETRDEAFRAFVESRRGDLMRTAIFLAAGDRWAAEDLVQTALVSLYVAWPRVRPDAVDAYARRCLLNALIDHRRSAFARRERAHAELPELDGLDTDGIDMQSSVFRALGRLPPRMRAAVVLRHLLDLSVDETAAALRCSSGTVKSQTARGLDQLRAALANDQLLGDPGRVSPTPARGDR